MHRLRSASCRRLCLTPRLGEDVDIVHKSYARRFVRNLGTSSSETRYGFNQHGLPASMIGYASNSSQIAKLLTPIRQVGEDIVATLAGGSGTSVKIPQIWLRDHCQCRECVHPETRQRLLDTFAITDFEPAQQARVEDAELHVTWKDGHKSQYNLQWLESAFDRGGKLARLRADFSPIWWQDVGISNTPPEVDYEVVMNSDEGLRDWTRKIREVGFCFVDGVPKTPEATEKLLERIGPIRTTHYGGFWDFTSNLASKDTAYTSLGLDPHTDTNYFTEPAGLQMFHLLSHTDGSGGENQLVDGFRAAQELLKQNPTAYDILSKHRTTSHASGNEGISIQPLGSFPTFEHAQESGELYRVRWNNSDRASISISDIQEVRDWYWAARKFNDIVKSTTKDSESWRYEVLLKPGRPLIFDNWRVLHGRSAFTGKRRMCGGYINRDDFISRYKMTNIGKEEVLNNGIN